jgi:hypothetical protein
MSIRFRTADPSKLLGLFNQAIANAHVSGAGSSITTWAHVVHSQKSFYTHRSANWADKAWLRAEIENGHLAFYVLAYNGVTLSRDVYAYYAGHLIETFIRHFYRLFSVGSATPNPDAHDAPF